MWLSISKVFTYLLLLILGNLFIVGAYGKATFALAIFHITYFICLIGVPHVFVPWIIKKKDAKSVFSFLLTCTSVFLIITMVFSIKNVYFLPLAIALPTLFFRDIGISFLRVKHEYAKVQFFLMLQALITPIAAFILVKYSELGITLSYFFGFFISSLFVFCITKSELYSLFQISFKPDVVRNYLRKGFIVSLIIFSFLLLGWIDSIILGVMSTFENVAKYNIAGPISNVITLIPISLSMFLLTRSAEEKVKKYSEGMFHRTLRLSFSFSLILAILLNSFLFLIVKIFFKKYVGIEAFVMILSIGILFYAVYNLMYTYLAGKLTPEKAFWPIVIAALLNIVLDIALIPKFGLYGITAATTIAHLVAFSLLAFKMNLLKRYYFVYILVLFVPLSFYLKYLGLITLIFAIPILFFGRLIEKGDLAVVVNIVKGLFVRDKV